MKLNCELGGSLLLIYRPCGFSQFFIFILVLACEENHCVLLILEVRVDLFLLSTHDPLFNVYQTNVHLLQVASNHD